MSKFKKYLLAVLIGLALPAMVLADTPTYNFFKYDFSKGLLSLSRAVSQVLFAGSDLTATSTNALLEIQASSTPGLYVNTGIQVGNAAGGGTQCAQFDNDGLLTGSGSACGTGSGGNSDWVVQPFSSFDVLTPSTSIPIYSTTTAPSDGSGFGVFANRNWYTTVNAQDTAYTGEMRTGYQFVNSIVGGSLFTGTYGFATTSITTQELNDGGAIPPIGIYGEGQFGGIFGYTTNGIAGVFGFSQGAAAGVYGIGQQIGVYGTALSSGGAGLIGNGDIGVSVSPNTGGIGVKTDCNGDATCLAIQAFGNVSITGNSTTTGTGYYGTLGLNNEYISSWQDLGNFIQSSNWDYTTFDGESFIQPTSSIGTYVSTTVADGSAEGSFVHRSWNDAGGETYTEQRNGFNYDFGDVQVYSNYFLATSSNSATTTTGVIGEGSSVGVFGYTQAGFGGVYGVAPAGSGVSGTGAIGGTFSGTQLGLTSSCSEPDCYAASFSSGRINFGQISNPGSPSAGDFWWNGTNLDFYDGTTLHDLLAGGTGGSNWAFDNVAGTNVLTPSTSIPIYSTSTDVDGLGVGYNIFSSRNIITSGDFPGFELPSEFRSNYLIQNDTLGDGQILAGVYGQATSTADDATELYYAPTTTIGVVGLGGQVGVYGYTEKDSGTGVIGSAGPSAFQGVQGTKTITDALGTDSVGGGLALDIAGTAYGAYGSCLGVDDPGRTCYGLYSLGNLLVEGNSQFNGNASTTGSLNVGQLSIGSLYFPTADGTSGQALVTDGAGNISFQTVSGGGGSSTQWDAIFSGTALAPTSSIAGIYVSASSTIAANFRVDGPTVITGLLTDPDARLTTINSTTTNVDSLNVVNATTTGKTVLGSTNPTNDFGKLWIGGDWYASGNGTTTGSLHIGSSSLILESGSIQNTTGDLTIKADGPDPAAQKVIINDELLVNGTTTFAVTPKSAGVPVNNDDVVNKLYADGIAAGLSPRASVDAATTAPLAAVIYNNGLANDGVGATLTGVSLGALGSIDGVTLTVGQRLLVKDQVSVSTFQNGIYTVTVVGNAGTAFILTRATDYDIGTECPAGTFMLVISGTVNANFQFAQTTGGTITMGTTGLVFTKINTTPANTAGNGISITGGSVINADYDSSTIGLISTKLAVLDSGITNAKILNGTINLLTKVNQTAGLTLNSLFTGSDNRLAVLNATSSLLDTATIGTLTNSVFLSSPDSRIAVLNSTTTNVDALNLLSITGSTQCLHVDASGVVSGTGSDCGSGGGATGDPGSWSTNNLIASALTPTSTANGFFVNGSSTVNSNFRVDGTSVFTGLITGVNETLTGLITAVTGSIGTLNVTTESRNALLHASSTDIGALQVNGNSAITGSETITGGLTVNGTFTLGAASGFLKATAGVVGTSLINLAADVTGQLPFANIAQGSARSVLGVAGNATANVASIQGTANQTLVVNAAGTALAFGTLAPGGGGTNITTYTTGDMLFASAANVLSKLADVATGNVLISGGVGAAPSWGKVGLSTAVSGTLGVGNGGTGQTTYTNGQLLIGNTTGSTLTKATLTGTTNQVVVTNGAGSITLSLPQSIATGSTVQFAQLGLGAAAGTNALNLQGGFKVKVITKANVDYTATASDYIIAYTSILAGGNIITLPTAATVGAGFQLIIKDQSGTASSKPLSLRTLDGARIEGALSPVSLPFNFGSGLIYTDGTDWFYIATNGIVPSSSTNADTGVMTAVTAAAAGTTDRAISLTFQPSVIELSYYIQGKDGASASNFNQYQGVATFKGTTLTSNRIEGFNPASGDNVTIANSVYTPSKPDLAPAVDIGLDVGANGSRIIVTIPSVTASGFTIRSTVTGATTFSGPARAQIAWRAWR